MPHIVLFPKFHKPKLSQSAKVVVSYAKCIIKPLARNIRLGLKAVYNQICRYSNMIFKVTGLFIIMFLLLSALIIIAIFIILKRTSSLHYIRVYFMTKSK